MLTCRRGRGLRVLRGCGGILFRGLRHGGGRCGGFLRRGGAGRGFFAVLCRGFGIGRGAGSSAGVSSVSSAGAGVASAAGVAVGAGVASAAGVAVSAGVAAPGRSYDRLTQYIGLAHDGADRLIRGDRARQRDIAVLLIRGDGARGAARKQRNTAAVLFLIARNDNLHVAAVGLIFAVCDAAAHALPPSIRPHTMP